MFDELVKIMQKLSESQVKTSQEQGFNHFKPEELVPASDHRALQHKYISLLEDNNQDLRTWLITINNQNQLIYQNNILVLNDKLINQIRIIEQMNQDLENANLKIADYQRKYEAE